MRIVSGTGCVAAIALLSLAGACEKGSAPRDSGITTTEEWVPGSVDFSRLDALMDRPVRDDIARQIVARDAEYFSCDVVLRTPDDFAAFASSSGARVTTGIASAVSRERSRVVTVGDENEGYLVREVSLGVDSGLEVDGTSTTIGDVWIQDPSQRIVFSNGEAVRQTALDLDESAFGTLVASTGRVVLMLGMGTDGSQHVDAVMPMDGQEIITTFDHDGEPTGAPRSNLAELQQALAASTPAQNM